MPTPRSAYSLAVAIRSGKTEEAEKLLQQASAQSRPRLELLLGNAMWGRYLELSQARPNRASGCRRTRKNRNGRCEVSYKADSRRRRKNRPLAMRAPQPPCISCKLYWAMASYDEAIALLEDKETGPLALIEKEHPTASRPQYAIEAYKAALRAYVSGIAAAGQESDQPRCNPWKSSCNASGGADGKSAEQLTRIYIGMGMALQKQMEELRAAGKQQEATRVAGAFATFLDRIHAQQATRELAYACLAGANVLRRRQRRSNGPTNFYLSGSRKR